MPTSSLTVSPMSDNSFRPVATVARAPASQKCEKCPCQPPPHPSGAGNTGPPVLKLCDGHANSTHCLYSNSPGPPPTLPKSRNHCARGSPPKSRISGHQNSRLLRGASKQDQTNDLSYYMGEGQKDKLEGKEGLNRRVVEVMFGRDPKGCIP